MPVTATPVGEIPATVIEAMWADGRNVGLGWISAAVHAEETGLGRLHLGLLNATPASVLELSSVRNGREPVLEALSFVQKHADSREGIPPARIDAGKSARVEQASLFHWRGISFLAMRMRHDGERCYFLWAAPRDLRAHPVPAATVDEPVAAYA